MGGRTHLCPESSGNSGRTRAGTGMTLEKQRGPPPLCQTDPRSGIPSDGSTSTPPAWASVSTEPPGSVLPEREPLSKRGTCLGTKGEDGAQDCLGCATVNLLGGLCGTQPPYCPSWLWYDTPENGEKILQSQEDSPEFQAVYMPREELLLPLPARRSAFEDRAPACHWCVRGDHMATVDLTPLRRKTGSHHIKRGRRQLHDTLIRRVAGTVGCNLSSFIPQRNGLMWSNPRSNTGEAAAMRPNSLRQVPTETWWPSLKRLAGGEWTSCKGGKTNVSPNCQPE